VAEIFRSIDRRERLSDLDCELLVRWMWKLEGLQWHLAFVDMPEYVYTQTRTLIERVATSEPFEEVRADVVLAVSRIEKNDEGFEDWPIGLDMPPSPNGGMLASGVFGRIAILTSLRIHADVISPQFGLYWFGKVAKKNERTFLPPLGFDIAANAVNTTIEVSLKMEALQSEFAERQTAPSKLIIQPRRRVELPPV
jgi:hypothetical protein